MKGWGLIAGLLLVASAVVLGTTGSLARADTTPPTFADHVEYAAGSGPRSVAIGDLNGDGKPDLAVANQNDNTVSVLFGAGNGTFATKTDFATGTAPGSVAIGDLNGDGKADLAVANFSDGTVSVLLGDGTGGFAQSSDYPAGGNAFSVAIGDLNGDGKPDLAVANYSAGTVSVLLGDGTGGFGQPTGYLTGGTATSVAIGDLNGDGKPDLAVANESTVSVLLGNGDGTFGTKTDYTTGPDPISVAIGDLNGDSKPDLATANVDGGTVSVLLGNGTGGFGQHTDYPAGLDPFAVAIGDLNGDGKPDLAAADRGDLAVSVLLGTGAGTFAGGTEFRTDNAPFPLAIGDLNGDGKPDLVAGETTAGQVGVLLNTTAAASAGASAANSTVSASPASVAADGTTTSTITVTLKDRSANPVAGKTVTLSAGSGSSTISAASGPSNASGIVTFTVKDATAETVVYTAGDATDSVVVAQTASVTFSPPSRVLTVTNGGGGTVTSSPSGISCPSTCSAPFADGTAVTLTATPDSSHAFGGWTGACSGSSGCSVTMSAARNISASFTPLSSDQVTADVIAALQRLTSLSGQVETLSVLGRPLALTSVAPGGAGGLGLGLALQAATLDRLSIPQSLSALASQLTTSHAVDLGSGRTATVTATAVPASSNSTVVGLNVSITITRTETAAPLAFSSASPNLTLNGGSAATVDLKLTTTLALRYDTATRKLWLDAQALPICQAPALAIDATVSAVAGASAGIGVLGVKLSAASGSPMLTSTTHLITGLGVPDAQCRVMLLAPDSGGNEVPAGLAATGITAGFAATPASTIGGTVRVTADTSGFAGLAALQSASGTLTINDNDVSNGAAPTVNTSSLDALDDFTNLTPADLANGLGQLSLFLRSAEQAGDVPLPFMHGHLSDVIPAADVIDTFLSQHAPNGQPDFASIQELFTELAATTLAGATVSLDNLSWTSSSARLAFGLHVHSAQSGVPLDPAQGSTEDPHIGEVDFGSTLEAAGGITGLAAIDASATADPSYQLDLTPVIDLSPPRTDLTTLDRFLVRTGSSLLTADVPITTSIDAAGATGALPVHAGGILQVSPPAHGHMLALSLVPNGDVTLPQALHMLGSSPAGLVSASSGGSASASLGLDVVGAANFFGDSSCANEQVPGCVDVNVSWPDITNAATLSVTGGELPTLKAFDFTTSDPKDIETNLTAALNGLTGALSNLPSLAGPGADAFQVVLPLIGKPLSAFLDTSQLEHALASLASTPPASLDALASALNVNFTVGADSGGNPLLLVHVHQEVPVSQQVPLNLAVAAGASGVLPLAGLSSGGQVQLNGSVVLDLTLAVPISSGRVLVTPDDLRILPSSSITASLTADGSGTLTASLGPFKARLGGPGDPSVFHAAVDVALGDPSPGADPVSFTRWASQLSAQLNQHSDPVTCDSTEDGYALDVCAHFPLYLSNNGGSTYTKVASSGNNDIILRLPANDGLFDPSGDPIPGPNGAPSLDRFELPAGLTDALTNALLSFDSLQGGIDALLGVVETGLGAASDNGKLPFVGSDLQEGQQFVQTLQGQLDGVFASLPALNLLTVANIRGDIQNGLAPVAQQTPTIVLTCSSGPCADSDSAASISDAAIALDVGGGSDFSIPLNADLPGLAISSTNTLAGHLGWTMHLAFGLNGNGFYLQPGNGLSLGLTIQPPTGITINLGALQANLADLNNGSVPAFDGTAHVNLTNVGDVGLSDLLDSGSDLVDAGITAHAKVDWRATGLVSSALPGMSADFHLDWNWPSSDAPTVLRFDNVSIVPGDLVQGVLGPVARELNNALGPIQPFIAGLNTPLPVLSDISNDVGGGDITVVGLLGIASDLSGNTDLQMAHRIAMLTTLVNGISQAAGSGQPIPLGSFDVNPDDALAGDAPDQEMQNVQHGSQDWSTLTSTLVNAMLPDPGLVNTLLNQDQGGFSFPAFDHPSQLLGLLLGQDVDLVKYDAGTMQGDLGPPLDALSFPSNDVLPVSLGMTGDLKYNGYFSAGFDTYGIRQALDHGNAAGILNGFWISTRDDNGNEAPNLQLQGNAYLYGGVGIPGASVKAEGGLFFNTSLGFYDPGGSGKFRPSKFADLANGPGCVFNANMNSYAYLSLAFTVGVSPLPTHTWTWDLAKTPLFDLSSYCNQGDNDPGVQYPGSSGGAGTGSGLHLCFPTPYSSCPPPPPLGNVQVIAGGNNTLFDAALNDQGEVLWQGPTVSGSAPVYLWQNGSNTQIGKSPPLGVENDNRLNDAGQVLLDDGGTPELRRDSGTIMPLPSVGAPISTVGLLANPSADCNPSIYQWFRQATFNVHGDTFTEDDTGVQPTAISRSGLVVGVGDRDGEGYELVNGIWQNLNATPNLPAGYEIDQPFAVNDKGDVFADATIPLGGGSQHEGYVMLHANGSVDVIPEGIDPVNDPSETVDNWIMNDAGDVISNGRSGPGVYHAGKFYDLSKLTDSSIGAVKAINDHGQILAVENGGYDNGSPVLITIPQWAVKPTPEPVAECAAPGAPTTLRAVPAGSDVHLTWHAPAGGAVISGYHVYRYTDPRDLKDIADLDGDTRTYTDTDVPSGAVHYAVSAEGLGGEGNIALSAVGAAAKRGTVDPGQATQLTLPNGHGQLSFPSDLVTSPTTFTYIEPATSAPSPGDFSFAGQTFTISATDDSGNDVHSFAHPYTLTVSYDPSKVPGDQSKLNLEFYDGTKWQPILPCSGCSLDTDNHTITVVLDHLTTFALLVPTPPPGSSGGSGTGTGNGTGGSTGSSGAGTSDQGQAGVQPGPPTGNPTTTTGTRVTPSVGGSSSPVQAAPHSARLLTVGALRKDRLRLTIGNPNSVLVRTTLALRAHFSVRTHLRWIDLGTTSLTLHGGAVHTASLALTSRNLAQVAAAQRHSFTLTITTRRPGGRAVARHLTIHIKLPAASTFFSTRKSLFSAAGS